MTIGIPVMEYSRLEATGTKELQRRSRNAKINGLCSLCYSATWQGQAYTSIAGICSRSCGWDWLVEGVDASVVQASMSQDQYNGLQLVSLITRPWISGWCMCSNNLCINQGVTDFSEVGHKYLQIPPSPSSRNFLCLLWDFFSYSCLH